MRNDKSLLTKHDSERNRVKQCFDLKRIDFDQFKQNFNNTRFLFIFFYYLVQLAMNLV